MANLIDKKTGDSIDRAVGEREVQRPLHLPAELPGFPLRLHGRHVEPWGE